MRLAGISIPKSRDAGNSITAAAAETTTTLSTNPHVCLAARDRLMSPKPPQQIHPSRSAANIAFCHKRPGHADPFSEDSTTMLVRAPAMYSPMADALATRITSNRKTIVSVIAERFKMLANCRRSKVNARATKRVGIMTVARTNALSSVIPDAAVTETTSTQRANAETDASVGNNPRHRHQKKIRYRRFAEQYVRNRCSYHIFPGIGLHCSIGYWQLPRQHTVVLLQHADRRLRGLLLQRM